VLLNAIRAGLAALAFAGAGSAALAADLPARSTAPAPVLDVWNPWMIRARALVVLPDEDARLNLLGAPIANGKVDISTSVVPEIDISYFLTRNVAVELIAAVTRHKVTGAGALTGTPVGNTWVLPPTLTLQYHFTDLGAVKPYLGVGVNYTTYFGEQARGPWTRFRLSDTWGLALQAGADFMIDQHWGINVDVKKIMFMEPHASLNRRTVAGRVTIDPWLIGTGISYKF
jgi:outer membrane protein